MNKFYIHIPLFFLTISIYVNNIILAAEPAPKKDTTHKPAHKLAHKPERHYLTSEEVYEQNKHLLCTNYEEAKNAEELMKDAVHYLTYYAVYESRYDMCMSLTTYDMHLHRKKIEDSKYIQHINLTTYDVEEYDKLINEIWDPNHPNPFNKGIVKIARVYDPSLVIIQQRYKKKIGSPQKYFYALAKKVEISEGKTVIVMTSANINDHNPSKKEYKNIIIEKANSFTTDIDSEEDIRKGKLKKAYVNISGYLIEKFRKCVEVTYIESIDGHAIIKSRLGFGKCLGCYSVDI
ncbi:fam-a protein [Plasmodium chabaudi chabaudi]|uniref:Fam-a protein n=1 Tax=Plasmodium chabaudi chabaudi TaxID=31271 RepID=A0A077TRD2_PLACU|nr:fam-a protein [Plasmodium chabaudi chabaudi]SCL85707.1 fam-a protein [Plasmodium chabaudi chabaudi]VTZ69459.1 fam-a protein [Plasmodium chabaudi chabaudi]|eukprot:XP_016654125.1 fam-a protein [Plasmodium chabaudi chabaudi]